MNEILFFAAAVVIGVLALRWMIVCDVERLLRQQSEVFNKQADEEIKNQCDLIGKWRALRSALSEHD